MTPKDKMEAYRELLAKGEVKIKKTIIKLEEDNGTN